MCIHIFPRHGHLQNQQSTFRAGSEPVHQGRPSSRRHHNQGQLWQSFTGNTTLESVLFRLTHAPCCHYPACPGNPRYLLDHVRIRWDHLWAAIAGLKAAGPRKDSHENKTAGLSPIRPQPDATIRSRLKQTDCALALSPQTE